MKTKQQHTRRSRRVMQRRRAQAKFQLAGGDMSAPPWTVGQVMAKRALAITRQRKGR